jgi:aerobic carbon-monoxide dehydrogenase large subunit
VDEGRRRAADRLEAAADDVVFDLAAARFHVAGTPARSIGWAELAVAAEVAGSAVSAVSTGSAGSAGEVVEPLVATADFQAQVPTYPFGAHLAVVEVDTETGGSCLRRLVAVDDAGTLLNPLLAEGQVHGGIAQGTAQALLEGFTYDEDGQPLTANLADYPMISAPELPSFELAPMATPTFANELGAKGIGESGTVGSIPAVYNAVVDALGHLGVRHLETPLSPERIWTAVAAAAPPPT